MTDSRDEADRERARIAVERYGRIAFETYRDTLADGSKVLAAIAWEHLSPVEREAWRAAADAVRMFEYLNRPLSPARTAQRYVMPRPTTVENLAQYGSDGPRSRSFEPPIKALAGDVVLFSPTGDEVFVQRDGVLVADYRDDGSGVLRPVGGVVEVVDEVHDFRREWLDAIERADQDGPS
jgi:hypothetical protein